MIDLEQAFDKSINEGDSADSEDGMRGETVSLNGYGNVWKDIENGLWSNWFNVQVGLYQDVVFSPSIKETHVEVDHKGYCMQII